MNANFALFSQHWYRVKALKPALRAHTRLHRHDYREQIWYLLQDRASARHYRFSSAAYRAIGLMDGDRSVQQIWDEANTQLGDDAPTQDEMIQLLSQLHAADVLRCDIQPDAQELFKRRIQKESRQRLARFKSPLSLRFSLFDPDRFLDKTQSFAKPLFSSLGLLIWALLVIVALYLSATHWQELKQTALEDTFTAQNLLMLWLIYPVVKLLHELGHAYVTKLEGGEVHDVGLMLLVFMPVPYVDASAATAFRHKSKRMLVGAAGIMAELGLAALALLLWISVEPGIVRDVAFNVMLIGGISTLLFNGNPLLRYDGYYVFADALGIANLAARANQYIAYLVQNYLFGVEGLKSPVHAKGESFWFFFYAIASFLYRLAVLVFIGFFLIDQFFFVGVLLIFWAVFNQLLLPLIKAIGFLFVSQKIRNKRFRALGLTTIACSLIAGFVLLVPVNSMTQFEGVIWPPEDSRVRVKTEGFIERVLVESGSQVKRGDPLVLLSDPSLKAKRDIAQARLEELNARYSLFRNTDIVQAELIKEEVEAVAAELTFAQERLDGLTVMSPVDGVIKIKQAIDLAGSYVQQGQLLGYVVDAGEATARVVVTQADIDRVRTSLVKVEARTASDIARVVTGKVILQVPEGSRQLPSKVLSSEGGGQFVLDPFDETGLGIQERLFQFDIQLSLDANDVLIGERVYFRFDHGSETLGDQWFRRIRQLFLRQINV